MRSRYAAFARGEVDYLADTLSADHPDRTDHGAEDHRKAREGLRYLDLSILHTSMDGDVGEVLFYARIFETGQDRSFVELSRFVREEGKWGYASGVMVRTEDLPPDPRTMTRDDVLGKPT
jgi:SEC-C motif-containing protein